MSRMIQPFLQGRPISASIYVDRDSVRDRAPASRLYARVARNAAGDLWTLRYLYDLPVCLTLHDCSRGLFLVYNPGEPEVASSLVPAAPAPPEPFPQQPPPEEPQILLGLPCFCRAVRSGGGTSELWYSYEYAAFVRMTNVLPGYGTTTWRLDDVKLEEPAPELFNRAWFQSNENELLGNIWRAAARSFGSANAEHPPQA